MRKIFISVLVIMSMASLAQAGEFIGKIHKGNKIVGASGYVSYSSSYGARLSANLSGLYFMKEGFALGAALNTYIDTAGNDILVGPTTIHYFYAEDSSALFWGLSLMYLVDPNGYLSIRPSFGYDYFVAPNISFGPSLMMYFNMYTGSTISGALFADFTLFF